MHCISQRVRLIELIQNNLYISCHKECKFPHLHSLLLEQVFLNCQELFSQKSDFFVVFWDIFAVTIDFFIINGIIKMSFFVLIV